jgi:predicted RNase H-like nuclease (RuvC/YqgF family)
LKEFSAAFNAIGKVPFKEKDTVYNAYKSAIDSHYTKLKLEGEEKEKAFFQSKLDSLKANPNADKLLDREKREFQNQIQTLKQDILQYENNLGFFSNSKGADALKKEVESKINQAKRKIEDYKRKIKLLAGE